MARKLFHGIGPGKRGGPKRYYNLSTGEIREEGEAPARIHGEAANRKVRHRFDPFTTYAWTEAEAKAAGAHRDANGCTHVTSERQLNRWLANEKANGREVHWKAH